MGNTTKYRTTTIRPRAAVVPVSIASALEHTQRTHGHLDAALNIDGELGGTSGSTHTVIDKSAGLVDELGMIGRKVQ